MWKQENLNHEAEKSQSIETNLELTQILEMIDKDMTPTLQLCQMVKNVSTNRKHLRINRQKICKNVRWKQLNTAQWN